MGKIIDGLFFFPPCSLHIEPRKRALAVPVKIKRCAFVVRVNEEIHLGVFGVPRFYKRLTEEQNMFAECVGPERIYVRLRVHNF